MTYLVFPLKRCVSRINSHHQFKNTIKTSKSPKRGRQLIKTHKAQKTPHIIQHRHSHGTVRCASSRCRRPTVALCLTRPLSLPADPVSYTHLYRRCCWTVYWRQTPPFVADLLQPMGGWMSVVLNTKMTVSLDTLLSITYIPVLQNPFSITFVFQYVGHHLKLPLLT